MAMTQAERRAHRYLTCKADHLDEARGDMVLFINFFSGNKPKDDFQRGYQAALQMFAQDVLDFAADDPIFDEDWHDRRGHGVLSFSLPRGFDFSVTPEGTQSVVYISPDAVRADA